ncbi:MAG: ribosome silencing factor [Tissierellia bacterium]|nr:ribosome silencing factor [Tissierellia bacterium]
MENKLQKIVEACEDKIAENIEIIDVQGKNTIGDYFIIVTGKNPNQTQAIADEIEELATKENYELLGIEGYRPGNWILCDLNDIIVHIFMPEDRKYYDLERLWN